jgi:TPR repeat protein
MTELNETKRPSSSQNPLIWLAVIVVGLILFLFLNGDRNASFPDTDVRSNTDVSPVTYAGSITAANPDDDGSTTDSAGTIDRSLLIPPGMRARQYIEQLRIEGAPYLFSEIFTKAEGYLRDGSLADAHLLYFFAAREDHLPAIMKMAEMADPNLFLAENSLLDHADAIQAYKWYRKAELLGHQPAMDRVASLQEWAKVEASLGNPAARQLLLNF